MSVIIFTTYRWFVLGVSGQYKCCHRAVVAHGWGEGGDGCWQAGRGEVTGRILRSSGHNPRFGWKKLLFCLVFKLGVCPARDSSLLTFPEYTWKEKCWKQPRTGEERQIFWRLCQNPTASQESRRQRRQRSVCISMGKVLRALEAVPGFTFSLTGRAIAGNKGQTLARALFKVTRRDSGKF